MYSAGLSAEISQYYVNNVQEFVPGKKWEPRTTPEISPINVNYESSSSNTSTQSNEDEMAMKIKMAAEAWYNYVEKKEIPKHEENLLPYDVNSWRSNKVFELHKERSMDKLLKKNGLTPQTNFSADSLIFDRKDDDLDRQYFENVCNSRENVQNNPPKYLRTSDCMMQKPVKPPVANYNHLAIGEERKNRLIAMQNMQVMHEVKEKISPDKYMIPNQLNHPISSSVRMNVVYEETRPFKLPPVIRKVAEIFDVFEDGVHRCLVVPATMFCPSRDDDCASQQSTRRKNHFTQHQANGMIAPKECRFCKKNGESYEVYASHTLHNDKQEVTCPVLFKHRCAVCGATGKTSHTITYCPMATDKRTGKRPPSTSLIVKSSLRKSNGRLRGDYVFENKSHSMSSNDFTVVNYER